MSTERQADVPPATKNTAPHLNTHPGRGMSTLQTVLWEGWVPVKELDPPCRILLWVPSLHEDSEGRALQRRKLSGSFQPSSLSRCGPQHPGFNPEDSEGHVPRPSGGGPPTHTLLTLGPKSVELFLHCQAGWISVSKKGEVAGRLDEAGRPCSLPHPLRVTQQRPLTPQWQLLPVATVGSSFWGLFPEAQDQAHQDPSETPAAAAGAPAQRPGSVKSHLAPEMPVANWAAPSLQGPQLVSGRYLGSEGTSTAWRCLFCRRVSPSSVGTLWASKGPPPNASRVHSSEVLSPSSVQALSWDAEVPAQPGSPSLGSRVPSAGASPLWTPPLFCWSRQHWGQKPVMAFVLPWSSFFDLVFSL